MSSLLYNLRRRLARRLGVGTNLTKETLLALIAILGDNKTIHDLLASTLAEPRDLRRIARRSYIHSNGYDKIVLVSPESAEVPYELRMHIWWPGSEGAVPDVHNHDWDFASRILCGELLCEEYVPHPEGELFDRYRYLRSRKNAFEMRCEGRARLGIARRYSLQAGHLYAMDRMTLHRVRSCSDRATATLVLQGPTGYLTSEVYCHGMQATKSAAVPIPLISTDFLADRLRKILPLL